MALALTVMNAPNGHDNTQVRGAIEGTGVLSGSYTVGGEGAINWLTLKNVAGTAVTLNTLSTLPIWVEIQVGVPATSPATLFTVRYNYTTNKFQVFDVNGAELTAGAYAAAYIAPAKLYFKAEFPNAD